MFKNAKETFLYDQASKDKTSIKTFANEIEKIHRENKDWEHRRTALSDELNKLKISSSEINEFAYFHPNCAYTRNLIATDNENYDLIMLCWKKGGSSKIHNHPCDGCFIKPLSGNITESIFKIDEETNSILPTECHNYCEGEVSYMADSMGLLHKVENASEEVEAITLHLYCRPFKSCKVWSQCGKGVYDRSEDVSICCFDRAVNTKSECIPNQSLDCSKHSLDSSMHSIKARNSAKDLFAMCQAASTDSLRDLADLQEASLGRSISSGSLNDSVFPSYICST